MKKGRFSTKLIKISAMAFAVGIIPASILAAPYRYTISGYISSGDLGAADPYVSVGDYFSMRVTAEEELSYHESQAVIGSASATGSGAIFLENPEPALSADLVMMHGHYVFESYDSSDFDLLFLATDPTYTLISDDGQINPDVFADTSLWSCLHMEVTGSPYAPIFGYYGVVTEASMEPVPVPSTLLLVGSGIALLSGMAKRKKKQPGQSDAGRENHLA